MHPAEVLEQVAARSDGWAVVWPRLGLQRAAHVNRKRHATRHAARLAMWYLLDVCGILAALTLVLIMRAADGWGQIVQWIDPAASALSVLAQSLVAVCSGLYLMRAYEDGDAVSDFSRVGPGVALGLLVLHWPMLWRDGASLFTSYVPSILIYSVMVWGARRVGARAMRTLWPRVIEPPRALFLGTSSEVQTAMLRTPRKGSHAIVPVAELDLSSARGAVRTGSMELDSLLQRVIQDNDVDTTLLCSQFDDVELSQIVGTSEAAGCRVISLSRMYSVSRVSPTLKTYGRTPIVELTQPGIRGRDLVLKRCFDVVAASILIALLSPVMLLVALLVKRSSPGPALFRQQRVGYKGRPFDIFKFRSMRADAEAHLEELRNESIYEDARLFKVIDDPRVTRLGHWLRRTSLDELPQLFNVLGGSMSLVGPRPPLPREVASYGNRSFLRFDVKPGITGPWQVNGRNTITSFDEVIALEAAYVNGWTIWRDFAILARTVPVVLRMEGAR
jgi:exopolysaccharide biosynthesis polyprenyl glycosylphosphotransferase